MSVSEGTTQDLSKSEEFILVKLALNPHLNEEEMRAEMEADEENFKNCVNTLVERGYVTIQGRGSDNIWKITELGRIALEKFATVLRYDLMYARKKEGVKTDVIQGLNKRKLMFQRALNACKGRDVLDEAEADGS